ncbi:MAG: amino acid permease [Deltaproteobacteria bacterium]|nr:amino acid permease [Deltaproteobacteria bacterium]MBW2307226.1 amino acid permease [Deltaproteobacteria bacterium]
MAAKNNVGNKHPVEEISFARELGCFDASMIGVGGMIGAGVFVLTGIAAGEAGPSSLLAFFFNGIVTLFTAMSYAELASAIPEAGGGYTYIKRAMPATLGFAMGWVLWFAYIVACSLYANGFSAYFLEFVQKYFSMSTQAALNLLGLYWTRAILTLSIGALFIWINVRGVFFTGKSENIMVMGKIIVLGIFIIFGLTEIFRTPAETMANFSPMFPRGFGGMITAMGLTFIAFQGYDLISTVGEEVIEPEKNIPRAIFIALGISTLIYLLIVFVSLGAIRPQGISSWEFLGTYKETAIIRASEQFMPRFGVFIILFGGLLSTISALNATILAGSRVAFSLGRDRWLPEVVGMIHHKFRTPHVAVLSTGILLLAMGSFFPIEVVGSAASTLFLLVFSMVNLSVIVSRRKNLELKRRYSVPLYPLTPLAGLFCSLALAMYQYTYDPRTWYISIGWILMSIVVYYLFFSNVAKQDELMQVESTVPDFVRDRFSVMVPLSNPDNVPRLLELAIPLAKANNGEIIAATIVSVPKTLPLVDGIRYVHNHRPLLRKAADYARAKGITLRTTIKVAHDAAEGIIDTARKERADIVLMGWKGFTTSKEKIMGEITDHLMKYAPCNLIVVKFGAEKAIKKILLPTAGRPNARLAAKFTSTIAQELNAGVDTVCVLSPETDSETRERSQSIVDQIKSDFMPGMATGKLISARSIPAALIKESNDYDLVVIGATREGFLTYLFKGTIPEKLARHSRTSVMIVKEYEGIVKAWMKHFLG